MLFTSPIPDDPMYRNLGHMYTEPAWSEAAGARFKESWARAAGPSLFRYDELVEAEISDSPKLTQEEFKGSEYYRDGLEWYDGMNEASAGIIAERKDRERERQDVFARTPTGFISGASLLAVDFAGQLLDPLNVAAMFIPVVGQSKFISMAGKMGITKARAATGMIEGAVGTAMIEPIVYLSAKKEQADYGMYESLAAMAFGIGFGGTLHVGFGRIGDFLGISKYAQDASFRTAIKQSIMGDDVDVSGIYKADLVNDVDPDLSTSIERQDHIDAVFGRDPGDITNIKPRLKYPENIKDDISTRAQEIKIKMRDIDKLHDSKKMSDLEYKVIRTEMKQLDKDVKNTTNAIDAATLCVRS